MPKKHLGISKDEKRNTWMIHTRISLPDGSSATVTKRGFKSEKEAFDALEDIKAERLKEYQSAERFISWQDACMEYYHYYSTKVKTTTARDSFLIYQASIIKPYQDKSLENVVKASNLRDFKNKIVTSKYSADHKNKIIRFMRCTVDYHYQRGNITVDEFKLANIELEPVSRKNEIKKERPIWTIEQFKTFIASFEENDKYRILFEVFGHLGCRVSELRGLQVKHFNPEKREIYIRQQATSKLHTGSFSIVPPKTKKSIRTITLSERINSMLIDFIQDMRYKPDDFIFFGQEPVGESSIRRKLTEHAKKSSVPVIPIHSLRHSNVTWLLSNPKLTFVEIGKISERLGHESKKVTTDIYFHLVDNANDDNILDALI